MMIRTLFQFNKKHSSKFTDRRCTTDLSKGLKERNVEPFEEAQRFSAACNIS